MWESGVCLQCPVGARVSQSGLSLFADILMYWLSEDVGRLQSYRFGCVATNITVVSLVDVDIITDL